MNPCKFPLVRYVENYKEKQTFSQILKLEGFTQIKRRLAIVCKTPNWAKLDSNQRHLPCKGSALTN